MPTLGFDFVVPSLIKQVYRLGTPFVCLCFLGRGTVESAKAPVTRQVARSRLPNNSIIDLLTALAGSESSHFAII
jgi:hypothetical protein